MVARADVQGILGRDDVLVYTTPPLEEAVEVTGEISATLYASSSAEDTDWMVRVVDIAADGSAYQVVDGIARARYRRSRTAPAALTPGGVERYVISLWATSLVFEAGHRIGVIVSSSNFPKYDRHPNVFRDLRKTTKKDFVIARQTVWHSPERASVVHLPVIPVGRRREWIQNPMPVLI
jgi:putative CocE/NonD family hydrolase